MKPARIALILAAAIAVPAQASPAKSTHAATEQCGCANYQPETAPDPVNLELARILVATVTPRERAKHDYEDAMFRLAQFDRVTDTGLRASMSAEFETLWVKLDPILDRHYEASQEASAIAYAKTFTPAELRAATTFAATPEGRTVLSRHFEVLFNSALRQEQATLMADIAPAMEAFQVAVCKRQTAYRVAAGDKQAKCTLG